MKELTWPGVVVFVFVLAALVIMFWVSDEATMRNHILGYFDSIVPFIVGAVAGAAVGGAIAFQRGYTMGKASK
ncbi:MAG TPA: hypothetical protein VFS51_09985 [Gemmatimonadales bacterium]|nr:hypothetical protein [Gemmatimonadales bacterium]